MRPSRRRRYANRISRFEVMEPRLFLSGDPAADFYLDYFVENQLQDEIHTTLADAHDLTGLSQVRADYGFTGSGQTVAIIDSGIAYDHVALGGGLGWGYRVVGGFDFTDERDADPYDDGPYGSHGTHVAGIIGSNHGFCCGVAPDVDLVALRVFDDAGSGYFHWVEEALQWVHDHRHAFENPITAVNLSLGAASNYDAPPAWATLEDELAQLQADGIFISVAAGNSFTTYGESGLDYPAVSPHVVPVAAVDDDGSLSYFSQRQQRVIAAPGRSVRSTVPDYVGNRNGIDDDFARYSGTSMAAPYVAGASVLLREAYEFVGVTDVSQQTLYNLMVSTADTVYDPQTAQDYHRLNLERALDAVMPADDFGSTQATAYNLGTIADARSLSGTIGTLGDRDWYTFTAGVTGSVIVEVDVSGDLLPRWELAGAACNPTAAGGNALSFDVVAEQTYAFGLATQRGLGHYTLDLKLDPVSAYTDWGTVLQEHFDGNQIDADGRWFALTAAADGILTTEAFFSHADGDVDLQLFDANRQLVGVSYGTNDSERIDVTASAGDLFYLHAYAHAGGLNDQVDFRVTDLVSHRGDAVHALGTRGDDSFSFAAATTHRLTINGVLYRFESAAVNSVTFDGLAGSDTAVLSGTSGDDCAILRVGSAELSGRGYHVLATNVETVTVRAGTGSDRAMFYDSAGNDTLLAGLQFARLSGPGFINQAEDFETVHAYAIAGGIDVAKLFDSPGNDTFVANPIQAALYNEGFYNRAKFFEQVHAYATAGGTDVAKLFDSPGDDSFVADPIQGALYGHGFYNRAKFFEGVHAYATAGGTDVAKLFDSPGDDNFVADPIQGALYGHGFYNRAKFFEGVHAYATAGGTDVATLGDSAGDDSFVLTPVYGALYGEGFYNRAKFFEAIYANSDSGGYDRAYLDDSLGDDHFQGSANWARLSGDSSSAWAYGFEYVRAKANNGGTNKAEAAAVDYILLLDGDWD